MDDINKIIEEAGNFRYKERHYQLIMFIIATSNQAKINALYNEKFGTAFETDDATLRRNYIRLLIEWYSDESA